MEDGGIHRDPTQESVTMADTGQYNSADPRSPPQIDHTRMNENSYTDDGLQLGLEVGRV
jgi:hypothetical protein